MNPRKVFYQSHHYKGPNSVIEALRPLFDAIVESFKSDFGHDEKFLRRHLKIGCHALRHGDRQLVRNDCIHYSVGDCGSHIGILDKDTTPLWMDPSHPDYRAYVHYQVIFSGYSSGQWFTIERVRPELTSEKHELKLCG